MTNPYVSQALAEAHRDELVRAAAAVRRRNAAAAAQSCGAGRRRRPRWPRSSWSD